MSIMTADSVPDGAIKVVADLAAADCAERIFAAVAGPVGLLVNNAARFAWDGFGEASAEEFDSHMAVNARAPMLLIDALAKRHAAGRGREARWWSTSSTPSWPRPTPII